ncbi:EutN/CcmL family microcompartment protein [Marininema halotolerans]|uniref:Ethanolamine utilization protein EutN n=1 Tax=Marininema halotolerans TaxID=1155944 RepID=A0A1I6SUP0_9BACL|nr:EutN/CcmL family microcompartment protein [Marininema halotolerans]SFS80588.1 ethanolamine utilization protein EutN [Marininema halotolerans]
MQLGRVIGVAVATRKDEKLIGSKLLITQPISPEGEDRGTPLITVDTVGAGVGEQVIFVTGSVAARALPQENAPVDAAIVGIIDTIQCQTRKE